MGAMSTLFQRVSLSILWRSLQCD